jgi:hypothetical protein
MDLLNHRFMVFYQVFLLSTLQYTVEERNRLSEFEEKLKRLCEFEETDISRQSCRGDCEIARRKTLETFVWISSKNSASVQFWLSSCVCF